MKPTATIIFLLVFFNTLSWAQRKKGADYYFDQGEVALDDNKHALALDHFNECIRLAPYFWEAYAERASAKEALGDITGALSDYSIYVEANPNHSEVLFSRASLRYQTGHYATAKEDFTRLLTLPAGTTNKIFFRMDPFGGGADKAFTAQSLNHATFHNYLGLIEMKLKNYTKADVHFDSAIRLDSHDPQLFVNRGILKEHLKDSSGALADYQEALTLDPAFGLAIHNMAVIKRTRGQQEESEQLLNEAIKQNPNLPYPYSALAYYHLKRKNLTGALDDYNKVLELNNEDEEAWLYRGLVKENMKDNQGAFADYTQAITLKIDFPRAWLARGNLLTKQKRFKDAIEDYSAAITWNYEYGQAYYGRALAYEQLGDLKSACDDVVMAEKFKVKINETVKDRVCIIATKNK
jgi:tetratricopeptide (TPR) repeat protein